MNITPIYLSMCIYNYTKATHDLYKISGSIIFRSEKLRLKLKLVDRFCIVSHLCKCINTYHSCPFAFVKFIYIVLRNFFVDWKFTWLYSNSYMYFIDFFLQISIEKMEKEFDLTLRLGLPSPTVETHLSLNTLTTDQVLFH